MNYTDIINDLTLAADRVKGWAEQGFVPTIEKDIVLESLRNIYEEMTGGEVVKSSPSVETEKVEEPVSEIKTAETEDIKVDDSQDIRDEEIAKDAAEPVAEQTASSVDENETVKESDSRPSDDLFAQSELNSQQEDKTSQADATAFELLPDDLRMRMVHDLFGGDFDKAESVFNKLNGMKNIDEILIYISENFSWNPDNFTAVELINYFTRKF